MMKTHRVRGNSSSVCPVKIGMNACGVPSPTILYPQKFNGIKGIEFLINLAQ